MIQIPIEPIEARLRAFLPPSIKLIIATGPCMEFPRPSRGGWGSATVRLQSWEFGADSIAQHLASEFVGRAAFEIIAAATNLRGLSGGGPLLAIVVGDRIELWTDPANIRHDRVRVRVGVLMCDFGEKGGVP